MGKGQNEGTQVPERVDPARAKGLTPLRIRYYILVVLAIRRGNLS